MRMPSRLVLDRVRDARRPRDLVVAGKKRLSPFFATDLDFLLRQMGVRAVILNAA